MIDPGLRTWNFFDGLYSDFVRDAVVKYFELDALDGVTEEFVSVLYVVLTNEDGVLGAVDEFVLRNID